MFNSYNFIFRAFCQNRENGFSKKWLLSICIAFFTLTAFGQGMPNVQLTVNIQQPVSPYLPQLQQDLMGNNPAVISNSLTAKLSILIVNKGNTLQRLKITGSIQRISPAPMSISVDPSFQPAQPLILTANQSKMLSAADLETAFGNFSNSALVFDQFDWEDIRQNALNYKLPEGFYRICIRAYDYDMPGAFVEQCASFQICYRLSAPQFIMPFNTATQFEPDFEELNPMQQQIQFQWTSPTSTCGLPTPGLNYDFEIRRVFTGQTIQDGINSIPVFQKKNVYTNMFLFDTLLNQGVLQKGNKYIVRVKANLNSLPNSPIDVENEGYSQIMAFVYRPASISNEDSVPPPPPVPPSPPGEGIENSCAEIPGITPAPDYTGDIANKNLTIGLFTLNITQATKNSDGSYKGEGSIDWKPFNLNTVKMKVAFDKIKVNSNFYVTDGEVLTATDPNMPPKIIDLGGTKDLADYAGIPINDIQTLVSRIDQPVNILNQIGGNDAVSFPLGLENKNIAGTGATLAIMGITFTPNGTNMNILFNLNITKANGWLSLGGTNFCIQPTGFGFDKGLLYLPEDKIIDFDGLKIKFKKTVLAGNSLADTTSTHVSWNNDGLEKVVVDADFELLKGDLIPVDATGKRLPGNVIVNANFDFTEWNNWIARLSFNSAFEIKGIKGFSITTDSGMYYDHSNLRNPLNMHFPSGYSENGGKTDVSFQGFYMKNLNMKLPPDFATSSIAAFGFNDFIIDKNGVSTQILGQDLLTLDKGSIANWGFSIDTLRISIINTAPTGETVMLGKVRMPISEQPLNYSCILNINSNADTINYNFSITPQADIAMDMWKATLTFADHSSTFSIIKNGSKTIAEAHMNGGIELNFESPIKANIPLLTFEDFYISSENGIGISRMAIGSSNIGKKSSMNYKEQNYPPEYQFLAGGPNAGSSEGEGSDPETETESSGNISGFGFGINDFALQANSLTEYGLYFNINLHLGVAPVAIDGTTRIGVVGELSNTLPQFKMVDVKSITVSGDFGPIKIAGALEFFNKDETFGDGIHGALEADFIVGKITAETYFGKKGSYDYFGVGGSLFVPGVGVPLFAGLTMNGFGGGYYHNMRIKEKLSMKDISTQATGVPKYLEVEPAKDTSSFAANLILSYVNPDVVNMNVQVAFDVNDDGGLNQLILKAQAYIFSDPPKNSSPTLQDSIDITIGFQPVAEVDVVTKLHLNFLSALVYIPLHIHAGGAAKEYYFYLGEPSPTSDRVSVELLKFGKEGDALWAYLDANAYFCTGNVLPPFPDLPTDVKNFLYGGAGQTSGNINKGQDNADVMSLITSNIGGGFMFGAQVNVGAGLDFAVFRASAKGTIGFDMALMQFRDPSTFRNCSGVTGDAGIAGWYALGQMYAYLGLDVSVNLALGYVDLISLQLGAALRAGGPNPTWAQGIVKVSASIIGFSVDETFDFEVGSKCYPEYNPIDGITLIANVSTEKMSIYDNPWVVYNVPIHGQNYINYTMPPNQNHQNGVWTRTIHFDEKLISFKRLNTNGSVAEDVTAQVQSQKGEDNLISKFADNHAAWVGNATYEVKIHCEAYEMIDHKRKILLQQDSVFRFKTEPTPTKLADENIEYIYPIPGQQFLMKKEFSGKGIVQFTKWPTNKNDDVMHLLDDEYDKIVHFIPYDGSNPMSNNFVVNYDKKRLELTIPNGLKSSAGYKMEFVTAPNNSMELYKAAQETKIVALEDLIKSKSNDYSTVTAGNGKLQTIGNMPSLGAESNRTNTGNAFTGGKGKLQHKGNRPSRGIESHQANTIGSRLDNKFNANNTYASNIAMAQNGNTTTDINWRGIGDLGSGISANKKVIKITENTTFVKATTQYGLSIYSLSFKTSKYNNFKQKMDSYKTPEVKKARYLIIDSDLGMDFSLKNGGEAFDIFEVKGYERHLANNITRVIPPLITLQIPWDYSIVGSSFTGGSGNDAWAMENIYYASEYYKKSNQVETFTFDQYAVDGIDAYPSRTQWHRAPSENDQRLYLRDNWRYYKQYNPPANTTGQNPNDNTNSGEIINTISYQHKAPVAAMNTAEIRFMWGRDFVFLQDNNLITAGMDNFVSLRNEVQMQMEKHPINISNIAIAVENAEYMTELFAQTDLTLSKNLIGGKFAVKLTALTENSPETPAMIAIGGLLNQRTYVKANNKFKYFTDVSKRDLIFKYTTPLKLGSPVLPNASSVTKEFSYNR